MTEKMPHQLSPYSEHYRDLDKQQEQRAIESLDQRLEDFRLRLDLDHIMPMVVGPDVLDFPIGTGRLYPNFSGLFNVYGYDIAPRYIDRAKALNPMNADHFTTCELERPIQHKCFDTVVTLRTLPRIGDVEAAVRGVTSIMKPGARWIFNYPSYERGYTSLLRALTNNNLKVISNIPYDLHAGQGSGRIGQAIYTRYRRAIEKGLIPYFVFKAVDWTLARRGTRLFVVIRTQ